ncbi:caspase family protein, partial [candidate division KSB1 bacterium]|nr:caspase family protein [candidate division KSB1 bacterium]
MRRALLVGIDNYEHSALTGCVNDANSMRDLLARHEDGEPNFDCKLLTAPDDYVSKSFLREQMEVLFGNEADVALFYFAGHGTYDNLDGYLVTQDAGKYDE